MVGEFVEGIVYIRDHRNVGWSLSYLGITGALVGVLGVLGPGFAKTTLGLGAKDFGLIVLPLGLGIVTGILVLNSYGRYLPRRRTIEAGMIGMGILLVLLSFASPISGFLEDRATSNGLAEASRVVSLLSMVMGIAFLVGAAYVGRGDLVPDAAPGGAARRTCAVVSSACSTCSSRFPASPRSSSAGAVADVVGVPSRSSLSLALSSACGAWRSFVSRGALLPEEAAARAPSTPSGAPVDPITAALSSGERATAATAVSTDGPPGPAAGHGSRRGLEDGEPPR